MDKLLGTFDFLPLLALQGRCLSAGCGAAGLCLLGWPVQLLSSRSLMCLSALSGLVDAPVDRWRFKWFSVLLIWLVLERSDFINCPD